MEQKDEENKIDKSNQSVFGESLNVSSVAAWRSAGFRSKNLASVSQGRVFGLKAFDLRLCCPTQELFSFHIPAFFLLGSKIIKKTCGKIRARKNGEK